jgi:hypothetical protein
MVLVSDRATEIILAGSGFAELERSVSDRRTERKAIPVARTSECRFHCRLVQDIIDDGMQRDYSDKCRLAEPLLAGHWSNAPKLKSDPGLCVG